MWCELHGEKHLVALRDNNGATGYLAQRYVPQTNEADASKLHKKGLAERFHTNERSVSGKLQGGRIAQMPSIPFTWRSLVTEVTPIAQMLDKLGNFFQS